MNRAMPNDIFIQSGVVPYRVEHNEVQVCLITSKKKKNWIIPKGIVEADLSAAESAAKEAYEEAGVAGEVRGAYIGTYTTTKWGGECTVWVYPMMVTYEYPRWPEDDMRTRTWFPLERAIEKPANARLRSCIAKMRHGGFA